MEWWISPNKKNTDAGFPPTYEEEVLIVEDRVLGWQLMIADQMIDGPPQIEHSGYATLSVVLSYPELVWQVKNGQSSDGASKRAWCEGMGDIFPFLDPANAIISDMLKDMYRELHAECIIAA